jgi:hypothetical protein
LTGGLRFQRGLSQQRKIAESLRFICLLNFSLPRKAAPMKTSTATFFLAIGVLVIATARPTSANLIVNGDFQTGTFAGWTTTPAATGSDFGVTTLPPAHDTLGAFFHATGSDFDSISQTFVTTPGATYHLTFFYEVVEPGSPPNNGFRVLFNGVVIFENLNAISGFGPFSFPNLVATGSLTTLEFQGRNLLGSDYLDDVDLTSTPAPNVGGIGYWANHPEAWCVLTITLGCQSYTQAEAIAIMLHPTSKDMTYQLAAQLAAAKLNVDCAFTDSSCVASSITAADTWLCSHPIGSNVRANSAAWKEITPTYNTLTDYNDGLLCAPPR